MQHTYDLCELIFPCQRRPENLGLSGESFVCSAVLMWTLTAMQHTYDLCELIFPCQRRPEKLGLSGESFVCWSVSFSTAGMLTAMQHTYDLCEGMGL